MARFAIAMPVLPGKDARAVSAVFEGRMDAYEESRRQAGVTMERAYEQVTPMGTLVVAYLESEQDFTATQAALMGSSLPVSRDFVAAIQEVHGFDPAQAAVMPAPELLGEWFDPQAAARQPGLAFCVPPLPGSADRCRAFIREAMVGRAEEFAASRRAIQQSGEVVVLNSTPMGDLMCVYLEGADPVQGNRAFAASSAPFDAWFKDRCRGLFPPEIDFDQPLPPITTLWDWRS